MSKPKVIFDLNNNKARAILADGTEVPNVEEVSIDGHVGCKINTKVTFNLEDVEVEAEPFNHDEKEFQRDMIDAVILGYNSLNAWDLAKQDLAKGIHPLQAGYLNKAIVTVNTNSIKKQLKIFGDQWQKEMDNWKNLWARNLVKFEDFEDDDMPKDKELTVEEIKQAFKNDTLFYSKPALSKIEELEQAKKEKTTNDKIDEAIKELESLKGNVNEFIQG